MRGRTQGKKVHARSQRVRDYHQKQMPGDLWPLLESEEAGRGPLADDSQLLLVWESAYSDTSVYP